MYDDHFLEHYADETLSDARDFMARERLTRHGGTLEAGTIPTWLLVGLIVVFVGLLLIFAL
jgi:hypothetical protein